jgi:hypothetical protein
MTTRLRPSTLLLLLLAWMLFVCIIATEVYEYITAQPVTTAPRRTQPAREL